MLEWVRGNSLPLILGAALMFGGLRLYGYLFGGEEPLHVNSDIIVSGEEKKREEAISERDNLLFKVDPTKDVEEPVLVVRGKIDRPIQFTEVRDTVRKQFYLLHNIETVLYGVVNDDEVRFYTVNNYVEFLGGDGRTLHVFERKTPNFYFAFQEGKRIPLVTFNRPLFRWTGFWMGAGAEFGQRPYLSLEGRAMVFEFVEVSAYIKTSPEIGVVGKVRL